MIESLGEKLLPILESAIEFASFLPTKTSHNHAVFYPEMAFGFLYLFTFLYQLLVLAGPRKELFGKGTFLEKTALLLAVLMIIALLISDIKWDISRANFVVTDEIKRIYPREMYTPKSPDMPSISVLFILPALFMRFWEGYYISELFSNKLLGLICLFVVSIVLSIVFINLPFWCNEISKVFVSIIGVVFTVVCLAKKSDSYIRKLRASFSGNDVIRFKAAVIAQATISFYAVAVSKFSWIFIIAYIAGLTRSMFNYK